MIIFDRHQYFDNLQKNGFQKYLNRRDLTILVEEYRNQGLSDDKIKIKIIEFCKKWNEGFNYSKYEAVICSVLNDRLSVDKHIENKPISFSKHELDGIININDPQLESVLFIMMCLAKYKNGNHIYLNKMSSIKLEDVYDLAMVKQTKKNQVLDLHKLYCIGAIDVCMKPLLRYELKFIDTNGATEITFTPYNEMIYEYLKYCGKVVKCSKCGKWISKTNNKIKYCSECAKIINIEKTNAKKILK